jgi:crotonobetainyl-CoA:carnitine CoA-transferase CaiB-like acyl-CoA transferase
MGTQHEYTVPWQAFQTKDGYLVVAARQEKFWLMLCDAMERNDLAANPRFSDGAARIKNRDELIPILEAEFLKDTAANWLAKFREHGVPAAPVNNLDAVFAEPPVAERDMIVGYDHPEVGPVRMPGNPIKMDGITETISEPAPLLGQHTDEILSELLDLGSDDIDDLRNNGIIK